MSISRTIPQPLPRIANFQKLGFGLFLHYGLYSLLGRGEWVMHLDKIPAQKYAKLQDKFTAAKFDGHAIARLARSAGMGYACLTTRHHEGFSLYDTRGLNTFDAPHSPAGRDLVANFVEGCRAEGIAPFLYHTTVDWRVGTLDCSTEKFADYLDYLHASVEILCRNYGKIGGLWFDGHWSRKDVNWQDDRLYGMIRKYQPQAIIINNGGLGNGGQAGHPELDAATFEQHLPVHIDRRGAKKYILGEMCETMNAHWGVGTSDLTYKSLPTLIEHLCASRKVGANYLLNVGPQADGSIGEFETATLHTLGKWTKAAGKVLYCGIPVPTIECVGRDFVLAYGKKLYYFAHNLAHEAGFHVVMGVVEPDNKRILQGLPSRVKSMKWLYNGKNVAFTQKGKNLTLTTDNYDYGINLAVRVAEITL